MKKTLSLSFFVLLAITISAQTIINNGVVSGTWSVAGSPYLIQGNVLVADGTTLTIEPGVTVNFQGNYKLLVSGRLLAVGTTADSIRFTAANTTTGWQGIRFDNTPATNDSSVIEKCAIEYGLINNGHGGGIYVRNFSKLAIRNNAITNCMANSGNGGGIYLEASNAVISNNKILYNHGLYGGGICIFSASPKIIGNIISYNDDYQPPFGGPGPGPGSDPDRFGGGISIAGLSVADIVGNTITHNTCLNGGGIYADAIGTSFLNNTISYNESGANGGGIENRSYAIFSGNTFSYNIAANAGGGINCESGAEIKQNRIIYNTAGKSGAGLQIHTNSAVSVSNNLIANNSLTALPDAAYQGGGGVYVVSSDTATVISGNVVVNNTGINGGGFCFYESRPKLINNTIANNNSTKGGALYCYTGSPVIFNTIMWGNTATAGGAQIFLNQDIADPAITYSDIEGGAAAIDANGNFYTGTYQNNINANPLFTSPSAGSGNSFDGVTADWAINNGSPCINTGKQNTVYPATDYNGNIRVVNGIIDMGAIENQTPIPTTATVSGGGTVCLGAALPSVVFTFTYGTPPFNLQYSINGVAQPVITGISNLQYTITNAVAGTYAVVAVTDALGAGSGIGQTTVNVVDAVADFSVNNISQCLAGNQFSFINTSTSVGGSFISGWSWNFGDGATSAVANPTHSYAATGNYTVKLSVVTANGCTDSITRNVTVTSLSINPLADTVRTFSDSVILNAGAGYQSYLWNTGANTQTLVVKNSGRYKVTVTNSNGCTASDSTYVDLRKNKTLFIDNKGNLCSVSSVTLAVRSKNISNVVGLQGTIRWNQAVLALDTILYNATAINIGASDINTTSKANGYITYIWNDNTLAGKTVPDSTVLFTLKFSKLNASAATTQAVSFSSTPTTLEIDSINLQTNTPVLVTETAYVNGSASFRQGVGTALLQLASCDSVVYNGVTYYDSTVVQDTIRYTASVCDSIIKTVNIFVYHSVAPTITISPATLDIASGSNVMFTANTTYGGNSPIIDWYINSVLVQSGSANQFASSSLKGGDTVYAVLKSSLSCATDSVFISNKTVVSVRCTIAGAINSPAGAGVRSPSVGITGSAAGNITGTLTGTYAVQLYSGPGKNYILQPFKTNDVNKTNGVSTLDIAIIQNHILGTSRFTSPYQYIAADVNQNRYVSSLDILLIKRLILGLSNSFTGNKLWTFVDTAYGAPSLLSPFNYRDSVVINNLSANNNNVNFTGIKLGDVNFDYNNGIARPSQPNTKPVIFYHKDVYVNKDERIRIPVRVKNCKDVLGMQFTMSFNPLALRFLAVENNRLSMLFATNHSEEGNISFIWNDANNKLADLNDDEILMELIFEPAGSFTEEALSITSNITNTEMWDGDLSKHNIIKGSGRIFYNGSIENDLTSESLEVAPNPSTGPVQVKLRLLNNKKVIIQIADGQGKVVYSEKINGLKGMNTINLNSNTVLAAGTYFITATGVNAEGVKKLVIVK